ASQSDTPTLTRGITFPTVSMLAFVAFIWTSIMKQFSASKLSKIALTDWSLNFSMSTTFVVCARLAGAASARARAARVSPARRGIKLGRRFMGGVLSVLVVGRDACRVGIAPWGCVREAARYPETTRGIAPYKQKMIDCR